ncbi:MAG: hypothetical protein QOE90_2693 [Thermoplasmata archaeon]|nr:hypothetical protein [Thermoplasmata archaeon]
MPRLAVALLALVLAAPLGAAWTFHGDTEPSTQRDREDGLMWTSTAGADANLHVFFDVVAEAATTGQNPNDAALGTRVADPTPSYTAYLGVWRDCNRDGYLGAAQGALLEYTPNDAQVAGAPVDYAICPVGSLWNHDGGTNNPTLGLGGSAGLVTELLWIGPAAWSQRPDEDTYRIPHMIDDPTARVWGDVGLPGDPPARACPVWPLPRGTTSSTGGALGDVACEDTTDTVAALPIPDLHAPVSLFGDPSAGRTGLLQRGSGHPAASLWDCADPRGTPVRDPGVFPITFADPEPAQDHYLLAGSKGVEGVAYVTVFSDDPNGGPPRFYENADDANGNLATLPAVAPSSDASGSLYDAAQDAELGALDRCDPQHDVAPAAGLGPGPLLGKAPLPEDDVAGTDATRGRRQSDITFDFQQMRVSNQEGGALTDGNLGAPALGDLLGHGMNTQDFGLAALRDINGNGPGWHSLDAGLAGPRALNRGQLALGAPAYVTFYARVGAGGLLTPGNAGTYGDAACEGAIGPGAGVVGGWDCDPADWWSPAAGASANPTNRFSGAALGVPVGTDYELRDVDCVDDGLGLCG